MSKFKFRLATLLRLREATRDQRRSELAEAYRVDDVLQKQIEYVGKEMDWLMHRYRKAAGPGIVNVDSLVDAGRYELMLRSQQNQLGRQREDVCEEIERRRESLLVADRDVRVLEKLRQKQSQRYLSEQNRQEIKLLDETAQRRVVLEEVR